jgi:putative membrane protein
MYLLIRLVLNALALIITANIVSGFSVGSFKVAVVAAIVLGIINTFIKPVLLFLTTPLNFVTLGLFTFVVNAVVLWMASLVVKGLVIESFLSAIIAAIVLSVISTILSTLLKDFEKVGKKKR